MSRLHGGYVHGVMTSCQYYSNETTRKTRMLVVLVSLLIIATSSTSSSVEFLSSKSSLSESYQQHHRRAKTDTTEDDGMLSLPLLTSKYVYRRKLIEEEERRRLLLEGQGGRSMKIDEELPLQVDALYQGYGTHYVDLWVGTPNPQRQTVIVDTGSSVTAFPCAGCRDCGDEYHTDGYYDPSKSRTFQKLSCAECASGSCRSSNNGKDGGFCSVHMSYAEGSSWSAYEARDFLYAGGSHTIGVPMRIDSKTNAVDMSEEEILGEAVESLTKFEAPLTFGCQSSLTGLFRTQLADGIMGMSNERHTFWDQLYRAGKIKRKQFALCFSRQDSIDAEGTGAGAMTIGGYDSRLHDSPMVFAKHVSSSGSFFTVRVAKIFLRAGGGERVVSDLPDLEMVQLDIDESSLNSRNVIVDSGTTDTYFTSKLAKPFKKAFKKITRREYSNDPVKMSIEDVKKLPTLILQLRGVEEEGYYGEDVDVDEMVGLAGRDMEPDHPQDVLVAVPATHYMEYDEEADAYTPRIYLSESGGSVLGANTMQGHDVFFDLEAGRIGFAESNCDYKAPDLGVMQKTRPDGSEGSKKPEVKEEGMGPFDVYPDEESAGLDFDYHDDFTNGEDGYGDDGFFTRIFGHSAKSYSVCYDTDNIHRCRSLLLGSLLAICVVAFGLAKFVQSRRQSARSRHHRARAVTTRSDSFEEMNDLPLDLNDLDLDLDLGDEDGEEEVLRPESNAIV